jgi:hypothetical protein
MLTNDLPATLCHRKDCDSSTSNSAEFSRTRSVMACIILQQTPTILDETDVLHVVRMLLSGILVMLLDRQRLDIARSSFLNA